MYIHQSPYFTNQVLMLSTSFALTVTSTTTSFLTTSSSFLFLRLLAWFLFLWWFGTWLILSLRVTRQFWYTSLVFKDIVFRKTPTGTLSLSSRNWALARWRFYRGLRWWFFKSFLCSNCGQTGSNLFYIFVSLVATSMDHYCLHYPWSLT